MFDRAWGPNAVERPARQDAARLREGQRAREAAPASQGLTHGGAETARGRSGSPSAHSSASRSQPPRSAAARYVLSRKASSVFSGSGDFRTASYGSRNSPSRSSKNASAGVTRASLNSAGAG